MVFEAEQGKHIIALEFTGAAGEPSSWSTLPLLAGIEEGSIKDHAVHALRKQTARPKLPHERREAARVRVRLFEVFSFDPEPRTAIGPPTRNSSPGAESS